MWFIVPCYYHYHLLLESFSHQCKLMVFHWSLSDSKSPQVSRTLLSILAVLNNVVVWMVSTRPPTSKSSSPFSNHLVTVPNAPITIGIIVCILAVLNNAVVWSRLIDQVGRAFANGPGGLDSVPGRVIPKTFKMVLDSSLLNTQQYKVGTKGKVDQSRKRSSALPYTSV